MSELLTPQFRELLLLLGALAVLVVIASRVIMKIRPKPLQHEPVEDEMLSKCREMHSRGELSDAEFRTIKTTLNERLQNELRDDGQTGCDG